MPDFICFRIHVSRFILSIRYLLEILSFITGTDQICIASGNLYSTNLPNKNQYTEKREVVHIFDINLVCVLIHLSSIFYKAKCVKLSDTLFTSRLSGILRYKPLTLLQVTDIKT